ncbi:putative serine esterase DUF676 [Dictyocaulus viviparus]|uniref:Putative serine esterase DUF676 n=1 Tax=Dictyocaulus viviparus TaxID=29172 RepID=A0A0D8XGU3_DICVI|nr:putative serine esterase DUF676 [Dictyocaulus viviparus]
MLLGDVFVISLRLDVHADLGTRHCFILDVELWSMDRHHPPNYDSFEFESKRTIEISLVSTNLIAASRHLFFHHSVFTVLTLSVYASLVSVLPRRKKQELDTVLDSKSRQIHLLTGYVLIQAIDSIEQFIVRNWKMGSVHFDHCNINSEIESMKSRIEYSDNPWNEIEDVAVSLSSRLSLIHNQLVQLCVGYPVISSNLLQQYRKFRAKTLAELFFYNENLSCDISVSNPIDKILSVVLKSKYIEKIPRFPIFCSEMDSCVNNWSIILEDRFIISPGAVVEITPCDMKVKCTDAGPMGDDLEPLSRGSLSGIRSCFPWLKRKTVTESPSSRCLHSVGDHRTTWAFSEDQQRSVYFSDENLNAIIDFLMTREQLKTDLQSQNLFGGFLYSEQASVLSPFVTTQTVQPTHLIVFVHGLDGTCDDLSSYQNIFRIVSDNAPQFHYLLSSANHAKTWSDIDALADNLLSEVQSHVTKFAEPPARISFVAHSLGGIIVRAAVCRKEAQEWLTSRLHCLLTINSPHLGLAYVGKSINFGIQFMQWWKQSRSIQQLSLKDEVTFYDSFLFRLSRKKTFGLFRCVLLVGTYTDSFVPFHSALLAPCKPAMKDPSALGTTYREMLTNVNNEILLTGRTTVVVRYSTLHSISSAVGNRFTGRAAHIAAVEDDTFIEKLLANSALKYFIE